MDILPFPWAYGNQPGVDHVSFPIMNDLHVDVEEGMDDICTNPCTPPYIIPPS